MMANREKKIHTITLQISDSDLKKYEKFTKRELAWMGKVSIPDPLDLLRCWLQSDLGHIEAMAELHCEGDHPPSDLVIITEKK